VHMLSTRERSFVASFHLNLLPLLISTSPPAYQLSRLSSLPGAETTTFPLHRSPLPFWLPPSPNRHQIATSKGSVERSGVQSDPQQVTATCVGVSRNAADVKTWNPSRDLRSGTGEPCLKSSAWHPTVTALHRLLPPSPGSPATVPVPVHRAIHSIRNRSTSRRHTPPMPHAAGAVAIMPPTEAVTREALRTGTTTGSHRSSRSRVSTLHRTRLRPAILRNSGSTTKPPRTRLIPPPHKRNRRPCLPKITTRTTRRRSTSNRRTASSRRISSLSSNSLLTVTNTVHLPSPAALRHSNGKVPHRPLSLVTDGAAADTTRVNVEGRGRK